MEQHRDQLGCSGNCFDLALWLLRDFDRAGVESYAVGHDLCTPDAHIAVIALDTLGNRYLCDLGDQWLEPILIEPDHPDFVGGFESGFFPGAEVRVHVEAQHHLVVQYRRPSGKVSQQRFVLARIGPEQLATASHHSQSLLRHPLVEVRAVHPESGKTAHWEFSHGHSFWSLESGKVVESKCLTQADWIQRIHKMTGLSLDVISTALKVYSQVGKDGTDTAF